MGDTRSYIEQYKKNSTKGAKYPKLNLQSGDQEQDFFIKPLNRLAAATPQCEGQFHEYFMHYNCGADSSESLVCLNETRDEQKSNLKKCPACARTRKILRNQEDFSEPEIKLAKRQSARTRINWPVYDLVKRKGVEMLEVSGEAILKILDEFKNDDGDYLDICNARQACCLRIKRREKGINSDYSYRSMSSQKYALTAEDIPNITKSYMAPESVIDRKDPEAFAQIYCGDFGVSSSVEDTPSEPLGSQPAASIDDLSGLDGPTPAAAPQDAKERPREKAAGRERPAAPAPAATTSVDADIMAELDAIQ